MSAELPIFDWYGDRREFVRGAVRLAGGTAGTIYLAPLLTACGELDTTPKVTGQEIVEILDRRFNIEFFPWKSGQEQERHDTFVGQIAQVTKDQRILISDVLGGLPKEINLPLERGAFVGIGRGLAFSPSGDKLAVWARSGSGVYKEHVFVVDTRDFSVRKIHEGDGATEGLLQWSQDGKRLMVASYPHAIVAPPYRGAVNVLEGDKVVYNEERAITGGFSPDGRWVIISKGYTTLDGQPTTDFRGFYFPDDKLVNINTGEEQKIFIQGFPIWSSDGKYLAGREWPTVPRGNGRYTTVEGIRIRNLLTNEDKIKMTEPDLYKPTPLEFSPDNKYLVFSASIPRTSEVVSALLDIETMETRIIHRKPQPMLWGGIEFYSFLSPSEILMAIQSPNTGDVEVKIFDLKNGNVLPQYLIKPGGPLIEGKFDLEQASYSLRESGGVDLRGEIHFYAYSKTANKSTFLGGVEENPPLISFDFWVRHTETENKFDFSAGDILVDSRGRGWYLQNGGRYEITGRIEDFVQSRHKNMRAYEVPDWVLDKVPQKEMPSRFFEDQYGRLIDGHSARLLFLISGWGSDSEQARKDFSKIIERLALLGWSDEQIVFGSYNFVGDGPGKYDKRYSKQFIGLSRDALRHNLGWLKQKAPLSLVSICGHSQGADMGVQAAITHPDFVSQIIAICGPLKGVDRAFQKTRFTDIDVLGDILGDAAVFYIDAGEDPNYGEQVETSAQVLARRNVELYTFGEFFDGLVKPEMAILRNSRQTLGGKKIDLLWRTNITSDPLDAHGVLLTHEPFIEQLAQIIGRAA